MTDRLHHAPSLKAHISLVLTALIAVMMAVTAVVWMRETRNAIHEEVEAATRVAEQWLNVLIPETLADGPQARERLMHHLEAVGRIRANRLEVFDSLGGRLYLSPDSPYKAGRFAPDGFARWVEPTVAPRNLPAGELTIVLTPDTSRAVLDAWDHVGAALVARKFGHVHGSGVDDGILVAAGVDDAGDTEFGAVVIHDVGRDAAVFRGLRGLFALRSLRTLRALRGRFCRFS